MPTPEEQIIELLQSSSDEDASSLVLLLPEVGNDPAKLDIIVPLLMSGLSHDERLDLVEELLIEKQLLESRKLEPPEEPKTLLEVTSIDDGKAFAYRIARDELDVRRFAILICDMIRVGAHFYDKPVEELWAIFDQERADPEVKERHLYHASELLGDTGIFGKTLPRSSPPASGIPPLRLIDE